MQAENADLRLKKEFVNSLLHGFGILFGIISIPILLTMAVKDESTNKIVGTGIYGFTFLMVFTFSTLYHGFQQEKIKKAFKILDHISIYFLIAGTYTPMILIYHPNGFGMTLLIVLWVLTIAGTIFKMFCCGKWETLSTVVYLLMGWSMLAGGTSFFDTMPHDVLVMIIMGCCLYSFGVVFYLWEKYFYSHAVWHTCVLAAAICHYVANLLSV